MLGKFGVLKLLTYESDKEKYGHSNVGNLTHDLLVPAEIADRSVVYGSVQVEVQALPVLVEPGP